MSIEMIVFEFPLQKEFLRNSKSSDKLMAISFKTRSLYFSMQSEASARQETKMEFKVIASKLRMKDKQRTHGRRVESAVN
jgi:hypothetical protein